MKLALLALTIGLAACGNLPVVECCECLAEVRVEKTPDGRITLDQCLVEDADEAFSGNADHCEETLMLGGIHSRQGCIRNTCHDECAFMDVEPGRHF